MNVEVTALFQYLAEHNPGYRAKLLEVREEVSRWLAYVPQTFPHYTQHTVEHSEAIIARLSKLLFMDEDPTRPTVRLSGIECYVLSASAYLHDAGMVTSDREKEDLLRSEEWKRWTNGDGGGATRWREIQTMRAVDHHDTLRSFAADRQVRFLIAEFIRRGHHRRAVSIISQHHAALGRLDFGDTVLRTTIADVCVAHGLDKSDLADRERYPDRREIREELINVRFIALLLRIGDLLDMRHDRACSLLLTAACPLPADSYAHWTQYQRITHELVAPDRIELRAECQQQEEHRFLFDWCSWLVDEVRSAAVLMANSPRHNTWRPPSISLGDGGAGETIVIRPAASATYIPRTWQFELDATSVFQRLIRDVYDEPHSYLRELIQNALDAMRCQMYADLRTQGEECPEYPIDVRVDWLARYELRISVETENIANQLSGETEVRQVIVVDDCGMGMDQDVIERYFLQVGKSYYTSDSFRRDFPFHPISRFGVGFLAVFGVSDYVTVDTLKTFGVAVRNPIRLTLSGPRGYLLVERSRRSSPGTRIAVQLKTPLPAGRLTQLVRDLCRRVEFTIRVTEGGVEEVVLAEGPEKSTCEVRDPSDPTAVLAIRAIPVSEHGVRGELYVIVRRTNAGESWCDGYRVHKYRENYPFAVLPPECKAEFCENGLLRSSGRARHSWNFGSTLDDRRAQNREVMDRSFRWAVRGSASDVLDRAWEAEITRHLETSPLAAKNDGWIYIQRLAGGLDGEWWTRVPKAIPVWVRGTLSQHSAEEVASCESFTTVCGSPQHSAMYDIVFPVSEHARSAACEIDGPVLFSDDIQRFDMKLCAPLFAGRYAAEVRFLGAGCLALKWTRATAADVLDTCRFSDPSIIGIQIHPRTQRGYGEGVLLNINNSLVAWAVEATKQGFPGASKFWEQLRDQKYRDAEHLLQQYIAGSADLRPPDTRIDSASYLTRFDPTSGEFSGPRDRRRPK